MNFPPCATSTPHKARTEISRITEILLNCASFQSCFLLTAGGGLEPLRGKVCSGLCSGYLLIWLLICAPHFVK